MDQNDEIIAETPTPEALHALYLGLDAKVNGLVGELEANTKATQQVESNTADLVELFNNARGAFKVLEGIGKAARPLVYIVSLGGALLTAWGTWKASR